jgi:hypothetical protein
VGSADTLRAATIHHVSTFKRYAATAINKSVAERDVR